MNLVCISIKQHIALSVISLNSHSLAFFLSLNDLLIKTRKYTSLLAFSCHFYRLVFSHSQILQKLAVKHYHFQTFSKLIPLSLLSLVVVILSTRLAVILKFSYLYCYPVLITKQFDWQACEFALQRVVNQLCIIIETQDITVWSFCDVTEKGHYIKYQNSINL